MQRLPAANSIRIGRACLLLAVTFFGAAPAGEPQRLTKDGRMKFTPAFVNSEELAYVDMVKPELTAVKVLKLPDQSVRPLNEKGSGQELEPAFSPDGRYLAFLKATGTLSVALVIRNRRENTETLLPPGSGFSGYRSPSFSPDGKRVIFSFAESGAQDLFSVNIAGKDWKQLTKNGGMNYWPSYSPDGKRILFGSTRDGNYEIYLMNASGGDVRRLTQNRFQDLRPRFSPDGKRIAFTSSRDGNYEVYLMHADGTSPKRLTDHPERDDYPTWHPDGKRLVIVSERGGRHDLYLVPVE